jgi:L-malate glycosyltransferase
MMKICIITPFYKPIKGGISSYVFQISEALKFLEQEVYIITRQGAKDSEKIYAFDTNKLLFIFKAFLHLLKLKPDVLHSHSSWYLLTPCIIYKFFRPKTIVIHTFHTDPIRKPNKAKRIMLSLLFTRCNAITFVSRYLQDRNLSIFNIRTKTSVIYGGTNLNTVEDECIESFRNKYKIQGNCPIICFVGVLSWKPKADGVKILVKSFSQIVKAFPGSRLLIVGDGIYRKEIEFIAAELGIESKVIFTGFLNDPLIPLSSCDIYAHISLQEGFPLSILEAMSCGKAVIASKTGGIPELINDGENGLLVESTPEAISNAVIGLMNSSEKRSKLGQNAKRAVEEKFLWTKIAGDYLSLYQISLYQFNK